MAHRSSAFKHMRADKRKAEVNRKRKSALKTIIKKTQLAIVEGKLEEAQALYREASGQLDRAAGKGVIKKGTANRNKSRLSISINKLAVSG
jgi:small subunit ribosomal protein S20